MQSIASDVRELKEAHTSIASGVIMTAILVGAGLAIPNDEVSPAFYVLLVGYVVLGWVMFFGSWLVHQRTAVVFGFPASDFRAAGLLILVIAPIAFAAARLNLSATGQLGEPG